MSVCCKINRYICKTVTQQTDEHVQQTIQLTYSDTIPRHHTAKYKMSTHFDVQYNYVYTVSVCHEKLLVYYLYKSNTGHNIPRKLGKDFSLVVHNFKSSPLLRVAIDRYLRLSIQDLQVLTIFSWCK